MRILLFEFFSIYSCLDLIFLSFLNFYCIGKILLGPLNILLWLAHCPPLHMTSAVIKKKRWCRRTKRIAIKKIKKNRSRRRREWVSNLGPFPWKGYLSTQGTWDPDHLGPSVSEEKKSEKNWYQQELNSGLPRGSEQINLTTNLLVHIWSDYRKLFTSLYISSFTCGWEKNRKKQQT